jgi:outer membrane protein assembly factor BamB
MFMKRNRWMIVLLGLGALLGLAFLAWQFATQFETRIFALDAQTGRVKWSTPVRTSWTFTPSAGNGRVFAYAQVPLTAQERESSGTSRKNTIKLCAFDASTGRQQWEYVFDQKQFEFDSQAIIQDPPLVSGNWVVAGLNEKNLAIFDAKSGSLLWYTSNAVSPAKTRAFTIAGDHLIIISQDGSGEKLNLQALDAQSGASVWKTELANVEYDDIFLDRPAIVANDQLVFVNAHQTVDAFDLQTGTFQFSVPAKSHQLQAVGDALYINTETSLLAVDAPTGALRWTFSVPASDRQPFLFGLQTVGQVTYIIHFFQGQDNGFSAWLLALDAVDGHELWRQQLGQAKNRTDILDQFFDTLPATNQETFFAHLEDENRNSAVKAFSAVDGRELWRFPLYHRDVFDVMASPTTQDKLVFVTDWAPRWRNWLTSFNLARNN